MTFEQNIARIQDWAQSAGIYEHSTVQAQVLKHIGCGHGGSWKEN